MSDCAVIDSFVEDESGFFIESFGGGFRVKFNTWKGYGVRFVWNRFQFVLLNCRRLCLDEKNLIENYHLEKCV